MPKTLVYGKFEVGGGCFGADLRGGAFLLIAMLVERSRCEGGLLMWNLMVNGKSCVGRGDGGNTEIPDRA